MEPSLTVALLWILFAGTHVGLGTPRAREALVARLGAVGFTALFSAVAAATFALLVHGYALHRLEGAAGPALGRFAPFRSAAIAAIGAGTTLLVGALFQYPRSPMALFGEAVRSPVGLARITRHPFFVGLALAALAHALLATRLVGTLFFGLLALFAIAGAIHQDGKLLDLRGEAYDAYLSATSLLPFGAIASGRQRLVVAELPFAGLALGLASAFALRSVHESIFDHGGAFAIAAVIGTAGLLGLAAFLRHRRGLRLEEPLGRVPR